jgi:hypothetical protein
MDSEHDLPPSYNQESANGEIGSDELLSDDNLRLPDNANVLVRLHAVRAWLSRRHDEATIEVGEAALAFQEIMQEEATETRLRRRMHQVEQVQRLRHAQQGLVVAQQRLSAYEEAQTILEDCVAHTSGERVLVEYYLTLEELILQNNQQTDLVKEHSPWLDALSEVLHRIEHVGTPNEE